MNRCCVAVIVRALWLGLAVAVAATAGTGRADEPPPFVIVQRGELPIILSAPHGGTLDLPGVPPRTGDGLARKPGGFVTLRDVGTQELALEVAAEFQRRYGRPVHAVINATHRKYLDPNRNPQEGVEHDQAREVYDSYHAALTAACRDVQQQFRRGLLLDLHGQSTSKATVFRGTKNGRTVTLLRERFGEAAHTGPHSLFGLLKTRGWTIHPDPHDGPEQAGFTGGYIVQTYGSHQGFGIDAMQLEFGGDYRTAAARPETARELVDAVISYGEQYLDLPAPAATPGSASVPPRTPRIR